MRPTYVPDDYTAVTPYLLVSDGEAALDFLKAVFNAQINNVMRHDDGRIMHVDFQIDDAKLMLGQTTDEWPPHPNGLYIYVANVDEAHQRALENGASELMPPADQDHGDRMSGVQDPFGNQWWIATPIR